MKCSNPSRGHHVHLSMVPDFIYNALFLLFLFSFQVYPSITYSAEIQPVHVFNDGGWDVGFTPDGKYAVLAGPSIHFYDVQTWELARTIETEGSPVDFAISQDGSWLLAGMHTNGYAYLWDLNTGEMLHRFGPHISDPQREFIYVAISPDRKWILTRLLGYGGGPFLWNTETFEKVYDFQDGYNLSFPPDGKTILIDDNVYDLQTRQLLVKLTNDKFAQPYSVFSQDGNLLALVEQSPSYQLLTIWDWKSKDILKTIRDTSITYNTSASIDISPDNRYVASGMFTGDIWFWDVKEGKVSHFLKVMNWSHPGAGFPSMYLPKPRFSPDGKYLITTAGDDSLVQHAEVYRVEDILQLTSIPDFQQY